MAVGNVYTMMCSGKAYQTAAHYWEGEEDSLGLSWLG